MIVEDAPAVTTDVRIDRAPVHGFGGVSGGHLAVAMTAVRAIPYVLAVLPGLVVPEIFGAYGWPAPRALWHARGKVTRRTRPS